MNTPQPARPARIQITDELNRRQSLPSGRQAYHVFSGTSDAVLVLGCGPFPEEIPLPSQADSQIYIAECADFAAQMGPDWEKNLPAQAHRLYFPGGSTTPETDQWQALLQTATLIIYNRNLRLFPSFWGPILGTVQYLRMAPPTPPARNPQVLFPARANGLLVQEVQQGCRAHGLTPVSFEPEQTEEVLAATLKTQRPSFFFSINFAGLDPFGKFHHLLAAAGIPTAVWLVDNPWHLVSGLKSPFWKDVHLFVTDHSFIKPLQDHGARHVHHLPLCAWPGMDQQKKLKQTPQPAACPEKLLFVGRSSFPDKQKFFAGLKLPKDAWSTAQHMVAKGQRPHFDWWCKELGITSLWPEREMRLAGFGAEESAMLQRATLLGAADTTAELTVVGDDQWKQLLPTLKNLRPPVDYYHGLSQLYAQALCTINITSLLLPAGLTQRNFDVWLASGCLLTDNTPGLNIFPHDLVEPVAFSGAEDMLRVYDTMKRTPNLRTELMQAWKHEIETRHLPAHRMAQVCSCVLDGEKTTGLPG